MGCLRLRYRADGAQGVVKLRGGGNGVSGETAVLVVSATAAWTSASAPVVVAAVARVVSTAPGARAVSTAAVVAVSTAARPELAQQLVLVLDAPFT